MNKWIKVLVPMLVCALAVTGCGRREMARLDDIESYVQARPDSALAQLRALDPHSLRSRRARARHSLLHAMALDKCYIDVTSDSLARPALDYFRKHGPIGQEMLSWYYLGVAQYYSSDFASSIISLGQAYKLAEKLCSESYLGLSSMMIGYVYSKTYLPADALEATMKSVQHFAAVPDSFQVRRAQCTLGERFMQIGRFHEADSLFEQVLLSDQCDSFNVRKALLGQALAVYYDDTLSGASRSLQLFTETLNTYSASLTPYYADYYARALYDSGYKREADGILAQLKAADNDHERSAYLEHYIANKGNEAESITKTSQHLLALQDSIMRASMERSVLISQRDYLDKVNSLLAQESSIRKRANWLMAIAFILASVVLCMLIHYIRRRKRYLENDLVLLSEQMHLMTSELDELRQQYISAYKGQFQKISHLIELYYSTSGSRSGRDEVYKEVMNLATTVGKDQKTYASLERNVNRHLENAMKIYRQNFPDMGVFR